MIYDTLPKGGASQFHPHAHGFLASEYLSHMSVQRDAAVTYKNENGEGYWNDLTEIHHALGLSVTMGDAVAISPLVRYLTVLILKHVYMPVRFEVFMVVTMKIVVF
jgi:hypothetical protein